MGMWSMRWPDGELEAARAHADALGVPLATLVRDLIRASIRDDDGMSTLTVDLDGPGDTALLARVATAATEAGMTLDEFTVAAVNAAMDGGVWQTVGAADPVPVDAPSEDTKAPPRPPRQPRTTPDSVTPVERAVHAAAAVVARRPGVSPKREGNDPKAGCTHPPAVVRPRGGVRSCGNCGTVLPGK